MEYVLVAWWLLAFAALSALAFPLCARLFRSFPGRGAGFAPTIALFAFVVVGYWAGRVGFGRPTLWLALATLAGVSAAVGLDREALRRRELRLAEGIGPVDRRAVVASGIVFVGAFLLVALVRSADPAINAAGGEKFLDYGLLRSVLRADAVPIYDVWFAGETLNYYYGGHLAAGLLALLTGTGPAFAYNLALAGFYACLVAAAFELARAIATDRSRTRGDRGTPPGTNGFRAGVAAAFLVGLAGNLVTAIQAVAGILPGDSGDRFAEAAAAGRVSAADLRSGVGGFSYWDASRVIDGTINEFPFFAFLNGDLHAHMMGAPFLLLAAAVAYAYWLTPATELRRRRVLVFGVVPLLGGTQIVIHTWDFPTVFGIVWLALAFAPATPVSLLPRGPEAWSSIRSRLRSRTLATELERTGGALAVTGVAGTLGFLIGSPFFLGASTGQEPALLAAADRSGLTELLLVHGVFVAGFGAYLVGRTVDSRGGTDGPGDGTDGPGDGRGGPASTDGTGPILVAIAALVAVAVLSGFHAVAIVVPLVALGWVALRLGRDVGFETALVVGGAGLVGLVELVYVVEAAGPGRLNTVFKVYFQVWAIWGVALGVVLAELFGGGFGGVGSATGHAVRGRLDRLPLGSAVARLPDGTTAAKLVVVALVVLSAPYAGFALAEHFDRHDAGTLHATAFAADERPAEAEAIAWLDATATHEDTLLEAPGTSRSPEGLAADSTVPGTYSWRANPASSLTGVPTVAGWAHQVGYRGEEVYYDRVADVDRAYAGTTEERRAVLHAYDVAYVWVGPTEEARYGDVTFADHGEVAFENDAVRVYRIDG
ncbi:DUF2298 domain-containing protein [Halorubrum sp. DTA98]|uniref:DUF2298 domain-containing protein n=1 Tax=Halorubrum sp. DTA98 TaxID=3402163 RepID=UPI003AAD4C3C